MTSDLKAIRAAAEAVKGWGNCNKAWLDSSEDEPAAIVGAVCEDGVRYPVATVDCDQYYAGSDSLPLAKFYATANPAAILALLDRLEAAEKDAARYRWLKRERVESNYEGELSIEFECGFDHWNDIDAAIDAAMKDEQK